MGDRRYHSSPRLPGKFEHTVSYAESVTRSLPNTRPTWQCSFERERERKKYVVSHYFSQGRRGEEGPHSFANDPSAGRDNTPEAARHLAPRLGVRRGGRDEGSGPRDSHGALQHGGRTYKLARAGEKQHNYT